MYESDALRFCFSIARSLKIAVDGSAEHLPDDNTLYSSLKLAIIAGPNEE